jgi:hypothetical protein
MKQFFVFIYSKFSQPSLTCESIIRSLPPDLNFNFLCVDNLETRKIIQDDKTLDIKLVPCLLIVNTEGSITKYEGKKCHEYLSHYQKQQTVIPDPEPISLYQQPLPPPPPQQHVSKPSPKQLPTKQIQQRQEQDIIHQQIIQEQAKQQQSIPPIVQQPHSNDSDEDSNFNSNPVDGNQTSLLDDDDDYRPSLAPQPPTPSVPNKLTSKGKPSLIAQATAMQKSRLMDDEFANGKKK